jgi:hypothetical protein
VGMSVIVGSGGSNCPSGADYSTTWWGVSGVGAAGRVVFTWN